jgi:hypothetical protein
MTGARFPDSLNLALLSQPPGTGDTIAGFTHGTPNPEP